MFSVLQRGTSKTLLHRCCCPWGQYKYKASSSPSSAFSTSGIKQNCMVPVEEPKHVNLRYLWLSAIQALTHRVSCCIMGSRHPTPRWWAGRNPQGQEHQLPVSWTPICTQHQSSAAVVCWSCTSHSWNKVEVGTGLLRVPEVDEHATSGIFAQY